MFIVCVAKVSRVAVGTVVDSIDALVRAVAFILGAGQNGRDGAQLDNAYKNLSLVAINQCHM